MADELELVYGVHPVRVALRRHPARAAALRLQAGRAERRLAELAEVARRHDVPVESWARERLDALCGGGNHQGAVLALRRAAGAAAAASAWPDLLARLDAPPAAGAAAPLVLVLDQVQDPHNLGACLRTALAAGADAVVVPSRHAAGLTPAVRRTASGAAELVPLATVANLARALGLLAQRGLRVVGMDALAPLPLYEADLTGPAALVLGGEAKGLRRLTREACDELARIPMPGPAQSLSKSPSTGVNIGLNLSLNISVAAGIALFEANRQRRAASGSPA